MFLDGKEEAYNIGFVGGARTGKITVTVLVIWVNVFIRMRSA